MQKAPVTGQRSEPTPERAGSLRTLHIGLMASGDARPLLAHSYVHGSFLIADSLINSDDEWWPLVGGR